MKILHLIFTSSIFIYGCNSNDSQKQDSHIVDTFKISDTTNKEAEENFEIFYKKFNNDLQFQNSRIKYPLKGEYYDGEMGDNQSDITYYWSLKDSLDFENLNLNMELYDIQRIKKEDLVIEKIYIKDSGFISELHFKLINKKWYLVFLSIVVN